MLVMVTKDTQRRFKDTTTLYTTLFGDDTIKVKCKDTYMLKDDESSVAVTSAQNCLRAGGACPDAV